jgi:hypothetical protein
MSRVEKTNERVIEQGYIKLSDSPAGYNQFHCLIISEIRKTFNTNVLPKRLKCFTKTVNLFIFLKKY